MKSCIDDCERGKHHMTSNLSRLCCLHAYTHTHAHTHARTHTHTHTHTHTYTHTHLSFRPVIGKVSAADPISKGIYEQACTILRGAKEIQRSHSSKPVEGKGQSKSRSSTYIYYFVYLGVLIMGAYPPYLAMVKFTCRKWQWNLSAL